MERRIGKKTSSVLEQLTAQMQNIALYFVKEEPDYDHLSCNDQNSKNYQVIKYVSLSVKTAQHYT